MFSASITTSFLLIFLHLQSPTHAQSANILSAFRNIDARKAAVQELHDSCESGESCVPEFDFHHVLSLFDISGNFSVPQISSECILDVALLVGSVGRLGSLFSNTTTNVTLTEFDTTVTMALIDATAKPSAGILRGHFTFAGSYSQCVGIDHPVEGRQRNFQGAYNRIYVNLGMKSNKEVGVCGAGGGLMSSSASSSLLAIDVCLPASCTSDSLHKAFGAESPDSMATPICYVRGVNESVKPRDAPYYIVTVYMATVAILCCVSGIFDYFLAPLLKDNIISKTLLYKLFMAFSIYANVASIFDISGVNKEGQIGPVHCIRFFSMCWVVMGHMMLIYLQYSSNPLDVLDIVYDTTTEVVTNAVFSVDSFFFLSGLLLGFIWFKNYYRNPRQTNSWQAWLMFYVHRILRLSPPYFTAVLFTAFVFNTDWLSNMPLYITPQITENVCTNSWWTNLLYLNNYVHDTEPCFPVGWYLASEMQMFLFTPLLLVPLALSPIAGLAVGAALLTITTAANIITTYRYHYPAAIFTLGPVDPEQTNMEKYALLVYDSPYIRCQVYITGILVGWLLQYKRKLRIHPIINITTWVLALSLMLTVLLGLHAQNNGTYLSVFWRAMYAAFSRPAWGIGLAWIIVSCFYGYGGPINDFMSWHIWVPLGRLTYCGYLTHWSIIYFTTGLTREQLFFSSFSELFITRILPSIAITFFVSIFWSAFYEISFGKVEMLLLGGFRAGGERRTKKISPEDANGVDFTKIQVSEDSVQRLEEAAPPVDQKTAPWA